MLYAISIILTLVAAGFVATAVLLPLWQVYAEVVLERRSDQ